MSSMPDSPKGVKADDDALEALEERAHEIRDGHQRNADAIRSVAQGDLENALAGGEIIHAAKKLLAHGTLSAWVRAHLGYTPRRAQRYARIYRHRDRINGAETIDEALQALTDLAQLAVHEERVEAFASAVRDDPRVFWVSVSSPGFRRNAPDRFFEVGTPDIFLTLSNKPYPPTLVCSYFVTISDPDGSLRDYQSRWLEGPFGEHTLVASDPAQAVEFAHTHYNPGDPGYWRPICRYLNKQGFDTRSLDAAIEAVSQTPASQLSVFQDLALMASRWDFRRVATPEDRERFGGWNHLAKLCPGCGRGFFFHRRRRKWCTRRCYLKSVAAR